MSERVINYIPVERWVIVSRPCKWDASVPSGFVDLPPVKIKKILYKAVTEDLGPKTVTTLDSPYLPDYIELPWVKLKKKEEDD